MPFLFSCLHARPLFLLCAAEALRDETPSDREADHTLLKILIAKKEEMGTAAERDMSLHYSSCLPTKKNGFLDPLGVNRHYCCWRHSVEAEALSTCTQQEGSKSKNNLLQIYSQPSTHTIIILTENAIHFEIVSRVKNIVRTQPLMQGLWGKCVSNHKLGGSRGIAPPGKKLESLRYGWKCIGNFANVVIVLDGVVWVFLKKFIQKAFRSSGKNHLDWVGEKWGPKTTPPPPPPPSQPPPLPLHLPCDICKNDWNW